MGLLRRLGKYAPMFGALDRYLELRRFHARMNAVPQTHIGALAEGTRGKIVGQAMELGTQTVVAPLSGRACLYWRVEIDDVGDAGVRQVLA
ncbi:MAG TPA: hypothetical protein VGM90_39205, partial [Kofleriaceae bacterium]